MKRIRIIFEYLLAFLIVSGLLIAIAGAIIVRFYGDEVQSMVIRGINSKIDTKVYVDQVNISVLRKFPSASIVLEDITIWSSHNFNAAEFKKFSADTLFHAETVYLSVNLIDLLRKKYSIKQFEAKNGSIRIITDSRGEGNYKFLKESRAEKSKEGLFVLNELKLLNFECVLNNLAKEIDVSGKINELKLNGKFFRKEFELKTQSDIQIYNLVNKGILYATDQNVKTRINLDVSDSLYQISNGFIQLQTLMAESSGHFIIHKTGGITANISAEANNVDVAALMNLIPLSFNEKMKGFTGQGKIDLSATIEGLLSSTKSPYINANFHTKNITLKTDHLPFEIRKLNLKGNYNNGSKHNPVTTSINIEEFSAEIDRDYLQGSILITNFFSPGFNFKVTGNINLSHWIKILEPSAIEKANGEIVPNLVVNGHYYRQKRGDNRSIEFNINGDVGINDVSFQLRNNNVPFEKVSGRLTVKNDIWEPSVSGLYGNSDFRIEGTGLNLISYIFKKQGPLIVSANFFSDKIDLHQILQTIQPNSGKEKTGIHFPDDINIRLNYSISEFDKDRFSAKNVRGTATYDSPILFIDSLHMQTLDGRLTANIGMTQGPDGEIYTNVKSSLYNLNIQNLFYTFNNFGQNQITDNNIRGAVSGSSEFTARFSNQFKIKSESIINKNEIVIKDGVLKDFEPILALSKFIDVKELEEIHFATLTNTILINDNRVIIPKMDIQSNALNLSASGVHAFDKTYEYRIRLLLSELLYQKARSKENSDYTVAMDKSDTRTLFLKIYNNGRDVQVEYDREQAAEKIREDLKQEKEELKTLLNEELGLFKKDAEKKDPTEHKSGQEPLFKFEFDAEGSDEDSIQPEPDAEKDKIWKRSRK